jgi:hypothetical protein
MKTTEATERRDEATPPAKKRTTVELRLVSRPSQNVLREWDIFLPDDLIAALTMGNI